MISPLEINFARVFGAIDSPLGSKLYPTLKKVNKPYKIRREGSFVNAFRYRGRKC
jgi:hypothetical protein